MCPCDSSNLSYCTLAQTQMTIIRSMTQFASIHDALIWLCSGSSALWGNFEERPLVIKMTSQLNKAVDCLNLQERNCDHNQGFGLFVGPCA